MKESTPQLRRYKIKICCSWPLRRGGSGSDRLAIGVAGVCAGCSPSVVTLRYLGGAGFAGGAWNGPWNGYRLQCVQSELSGRSVVASVQSGGSGRCAVFMVRRRSTVRFRKGAPR